MVDEDKTPVEATDLTFIDGEEGIELNEVLLRFRAGPGTKIRVVAFRPREGITGLRLETELTQATVERVTLTFGKDATFPGLTVDANAEQLLCFRDNEWRAAVIANVREQWANEQAAQAELAAQAALAADPGDEAEGAPAKDDGGLPA